jgi:peptidoglycan/xylan/chitin deacetylase (PgdA/CDA1 family)
MLSVKIVAALIAIFNFVNSLIINKCVSDRQVALTFEDGPSIKTTRKLLDLLDSLDTKATFHVVTKHSNYDQVPKLMSEIISRGHVLGYRLEAEWTLQDVTKEGIQGAVDYRLEMIKKACGKKPKFVRTSYNATELVKNALIDSNLILTVPNFESYDYKEGFSVEYMLDRFDSLSLGSVISVQREFADKLFETTKAFVDHLRSKNYKIVTLQECTGIEEIYSNEKAIPRVVTKNIDSNNYDVGIDSSSTAISGSAITKNREALPILLVFLFLTMLFL